ncbi:MAG: hypothetical protein DMD89_18125 [Candidatus Rokuibacteriota bacterium]|nr:MAG: hypothetical protein DMD89_18125 [Candidatus Rokubacteria bacterium]
MIARRVATSIVCLIAVAAIAPGWAADDDHAFAVRIDSPTVKLGEKAVIVATISPRGGFRITESYRHRVVNLSAIDAGVDIGRKVVRGSVTDGSVIFRVEVVPKTAGAHIVVGVFRFSVNNGQQLDIKAAPFEATVTATE